LILFFLVAAAVAIASASSTATFVSIIEVSYPRVVVLHKHKGMLLKKAIEGNNNGVHDGIHNIYTVSNILFVVKRLIHKSLL